MGYCLRGAFILKDQHCPGFPWQPLKKKFPWVWLFSWEKNQIFKKISGVSGVSLFKFLTFSSLTRSVDHLRSQPAPEGELDEPPGNVVILGQCHKTNGPAIEMVIVSWWVEDRINQDRTSSVNVIHQVLFSTAFSAPNFLEVLFFSA